MLITALLTKHVICDFPLQTPYQFANKGRYGHPGGLLHAAIHGVGTIIALVWLAPILVVLKLALLDSFIHYHIDWAKNRINRRYALTPSSGQGFWITFGVDQYLHSMTYIYIVYLFTTNRL